MGIGNFTPNFMNYTGQGAFRYWCQTVLPLVYDDSLSYYELLNKMVIYLNNCIKDVSTVESNLDEARASFVELNEAVNTKYDELKTSNENLTTAYNEFYNWFDTLDVQDEVDNKLDALVEDGTIPNMVEEIVNTSTSIQQTIADWLADYAETSGISAPEIDKTLMVSPAAADAKVVGDSIYGLSNDYYPMKYINYQKRAITNGTIQPESGSLGTRAIVRYDFRNVERAKITCNSSNYIIRVIWAFTQYQSTGGVKYSIVENNIDVNNNRFIIPKTDGKTDVWIVMTKVDPTSVFVVDGTTDEVAEAANSLVVEGYYADKYFDIITANFKGLSTHPQEITRGDLNYPANTLTRSNITHYACSAAIQRQSEEYPMYVISMNNDNFYMKDIVRYDTTIVSEATNRERLKSLSDIKYENKFIILTNENLPFYRITFGKKNVADDYELTDEDLLALNEAIALYRLVDTDVSSHGVPADAYQTNVKIDNVHNIVDDNYQSFVDAIFGLYNTKLQLSYSFTKGRINETTGYISIDDTEPYRCNYRSVLSNRVVSFSSGDFRYRLLYYNGTPSITGANYTGHYTEYVDATTKMYVGSGYGDRAIVEVLSETEMTDDEVAALVDNFDVWYYKETEPETAPLQVISNRPNTGIIAQLQDVCNDWYANRDDNLTYGYQGILNTSNETRQIDCSTFVGMILRGYKYIETSYYTREYVSPADWTGNPNYVWSMCPRDYYEYETINSTVKGRVRNTGQLAQMFINNGRRVLLDEHLVNIEVGDVLFFSRLNEETGDYQSPNYFMKINHCAIVVSKERMTTSPSWDAVKYPFKHMIMDVGHENTQWYDTNRKVDRPYPLALRPLEAPQHLTNTELTEEEMNSVYTNNVNTLVLVCRPDFGSLTAPTT